MPEELNRCVIGDLTDLHCVPTRQAVRNLQAEGVPASKILLNGNTIHEATQAMAPNDAASRAIAASLGAEHSQYVLATIHRPENTDYPERLQAILDELSKLGLPVLSRCTRGPGWPPLGTESLPRSTGSRSSAIADGLGVSRLNIPLRNRSTNHLDGFGTTQTGGVRTTHLVPTVTLDWLAACFPVPNVIKIDVEEAEAKALAKSTDFLYAAPKINGEVAEQNATIVTEILTNYGYILYDRGQPAQMRVPIPFASPNNLAIRLSR